MNNNVNTILFQSQWMNYTHNIYEYKTLQELWKKNSLWTYKNIVKICYNIQIDHKIDKFAEIYIDANLSSHEQLYNQRLACDIYNKST